MKSCFIETRVFLRHLYDYMADEEYRRFQQELMEKPDMGATMPGCGGMRKIRVQDPTRGKGKRGGARIVYLWVPSASIFLLFAIYGKNTKEDLSPKDKEVAKKTASEFKKWCAERFRSKVNQ